MYIAHGPLSVLLNEVVQKKEISKLTKAEHTAVILLSFFFGILPDFDIFVLTMSNIPTFLHHQVITHSIPLWVSLWVFLKLLLALLKRLANKDFRLLLNRKVITILINSFLIGTLSHLLGDIIFSSSQIFQPLRLEITLLGNIFGQNYFAQYFSTPSFAVEMVIISFFLFLLYKYFFKKSKFFKYCLLSLIALSLLILPFTMYMNKNTYNKILYKEDGHTIYDSDFDTVIDYKDYDTKNNGRGNILNANKQKLVEDIYEILNTKSLTTNRENLWEEIKYRYGATNSYRLISQAYLNQNMVIEPVLKDFAHKEYNIEGYRVDIKYDRLLYEYLAKENLLDELNNNTTSGSLFFVLKEDEIVNIGIFLNSEEVGIVMKEDKRVRIHTLEEISKYYTDCKIKVQK